MSRYETEEEQVEAIKTWWKQNGTKLLSGLLIVVIAFSAWRYWSNTKLVESSNASSLFEMLQGHMQQGSFGEVSREALKLIQEQPQSPYAVGAALLYAKYSFEKGELADAVKQLTWVVDTAEDPQLKHIAHLRLARIHADSGAFELAEKQLEILSKSTLSQPEKASVDYVVGLINVAQSKSEEARLAFQNVVMNAQAEKNLMGLAQVQLDDLAK